MLKKVLPIFTILLVAACFLSYKHGSAPTAFAKGNGSPQQVSDPAPPPLPAPPAEWVVHAVANPGSIAVATRPAGGAGVQHVVDCVSATVYATSGVGDEVALQLLDGSGAQLMLWTLTAASSSNGPSQVSICGLNVVGVANETMTLEFLTNVGFQAVNLIGHDAT